MRRLLDQRGVRTIDSDSIGHEVLEPAGPAFDEVSATWPSVVVGGRIDRGALAGIVFEDADELRRLEAITHPHIFGRIEEEAASDGVVVVEMPVLSGLGEGWRRMVVDARDEVRLQRAIDRGMGEADARARMARQPTRAEWLAAADLVVPNHATKYELREAVSLLDI